MRKCKITICIMYILLFCIMGCSADNSTYVNNADGVIYVDSGQEFPYQNQDYNVDVSDNYITQSGFADLTYGNAEAFQIQDIVFNRGMSLSDVVHQIINSEYRVHSFEFNTYGATKEIACNIDEISDLLNQYTDAYSCSIYMYVDDAKVDIGLGTLGSSFDKSPKLMSDFVISDVEVYYAENVYIKIANLEINKIPVNDSQNLCEQLKSKYPKNFYGIDSYIDGSPSSIFISGNTSISLFLNRLYLDVNDGCYYIRDFGIDYKIYE